MTPELTDLLRSVRPAAEAAMQAARERQSQLTKPPGALGDLEALSVRLAGVRATPSSERLPSGDTLDLSAEADGTR